MALLSCADTQHGSLWLWGRYRDLAETHKYQMYIENSHVDLKGIKFINLITANMLDGLRPSETAVEDEFMRRFLRGTWHNLFLSEIIIKRQHNIIRIAGIVERAIHARKMYFLIGYTEELLSHWLQCPVKLELQTVASRKDVVFRYI